MRRHNPLLRAVASPPIAEADRWLPDPAALPDKPLMNLAQGVPSYPPAEPLREEMARLVMDPSVARYTEILGLPALRDAFAQHLNALYTADLSGEQVAITAGCNQAFCATLHALASPGDEIVLTAPYYFNHQMWLTMQGVTPVLLPCGEHDGLPDPDQAASLVGQRTKALVLVSPNNPTGAIYPQPLLQAFAELAARLDIALVLDETYKDFLPERARPHALYENARWDRTLVSLHSFSKSYSLTGYRVGAIVANTRLLAQIEKVLDTVTICANHLAQRAALYALTHLDAWRDERTGELVTRAERLRDAFARNELGYRLASAGGFFAWLRHPFEGSPAAEVAKRLAGEQNVLCLPGSMFGPGQDGFLRLSFTNVAEDCFPELVERLIANQS